MNGIFKGNFIDCPTISELRVRKNAFIKVENGFVKEISQTEFDGELTIDFGDALVIPGLCDMHLHAPQYANRGFGLDLPLLPWLEKYTFPEETKYSDSNYAKEIYPKLIKDLVKNGTTKACIFGSIHLKSTEVLMELLEQSGITAFVGKVNMDRNSPESLCETCEDSYENTVAFIDAAKKYKNVKPIITPRFVPSCSGELMAKLGDLAQRYNFPVQSHLSENLSEIEWVKKLEPDATCYLDVYKKYKLVGGNVRSIMAHCVSCSENELEMLKEFDVLVAHCPESNANITSGIAPVADMLSRGISVGLGSDIAAGTSLSVLSAASLAVKVSKLRGALFGENSINYKTALYLATSEGQKFFGEQPGFCVGNAFDAVVIDDSTLVQSDDISFEQRVQRMMLIPEDRNITTVYAKGNKIY